MSRTLKVTIVGDSRSAEASFRRLSGSASGFGSRIGGVARVAGVAFAAIGAAASIGIGYAVKQAADFQQSLNTFQAVSGATSAQIQKVSSLSKRLGADLSLPATSAKDAADAMLELNKAGLSVKQTMAAAKGVLQLSAAAETSNAKAAQITANALNAYGLAGNQASHVADLLAASAIAASGEMTDMADALTQTAATAAQAHVSINDTVTAISEMANKGIIGSQSGAALQQMLLKLESPTKKGAEAMKTLGVNIYDAKGQMVPFRSVVEQFSKATEGMSDAQRNAAMNAIFGSRAIRAANIVLLGGTAAFDKMSKSVNRQGAAADVAKAKMKGLNGAVQALQSAGQTLAITLGTPLLTVLAHAAFGVAGLVDWINRLAEKMGHAKGFTAKFNIAKDAIQKEIEGAIAAVNWTAAWSRAQGIGEGLAAKFRSIDWSTVGAAIGDGFALAVSNAVSAGAKLAGAFQNLFRSIDWNALGRAAGPGIDAAIVSALAALTDPSFWIKNWDLALAVALTVFGGSVGKIAGRFGELLARPLGRAFEAAAIEIGALAERAFGSKVANAVLNALIRLPGAVTALLGRLVSPVSSTFAKLSGLSKFFVKVVGIDAAINAIVSFAKTVKQWIDKVVHWFESLPNWIKAPLEGINLASIGVSIISGLWGGLKSEWDKVSGWLSDKAGSVKGFFSHALHIHSPSRVMVEIGENVMQGLLLGLQSGWGNNEALLSKTATRIQQVMNELQARLDQSQARATDRSNQKALADANVQLAAAKKSGKGITNAARAVQDALQQIRDTGNQRELDRLTKQHDKILAKLQALKDKAAAKLQQLQTAAGTAFDALASRIQKAFDAKNQAWVSPAQQMIDQIQRGDQQQQLVQAVTDAQQAVADVIANGGDVLGAQTSLQRAQHDLLINGTGGLQDQSDAQSKAHDQDVAAQQDALDGMLEKLRTHLAGQGEIYNDGMSDILGVIASFDGPFADIGATLGDSFVQSLIASAKAAAAAGGSVKNPSGGSASNAPDVIGRILQGGQVLHLPRGGDITQSGFAFVHAGERVSPGSASATPLGGGGAVENHFHFPNYIGSKEDLQDAIVDGLKGANRSGKIYVRELD